MFRREVEGDTVTGITQERLPGCHGLKNAGFSLFSEIVLNATKPRHEADQAFGYVHIEVVAERHGAVGAAEANKSVMNAAKSSSVRVKACRSI